MKIKNNAIAVLAGLALAGAAGSASAATWTFNDTISNTQGGVTATASAWSNTANGPSGSNTVLESAFLNTYGSSGLGVKNRDYVSGGGDANEGVNPEHAIDNDQRRDSVLFSFSDKVNLSSTDFGWISGDADFSVYAYTGSGSGLSALDGATYTDAGMLTEGWQLVSHNEGVKGNNAIADSAGIYSSYWLIGALNTTDGGDCTSTYSSGSKKGQCKTWGAVTDHFKLLKVAGTTCADNPGGTGCGGGGNPGGGVPEPGTLLLMGAGFLGLTRVLRRR
jgi:hypothetical protein